MNNVELTCPYCNAHVSVPPELPAGARVTCPRCDEAFPFDGTGHIQPAAGLTASPPPPAPSVVRSGPRRSNRFVAGIVLGVMLLMALTGLTYALLTQHVRRSHDRALPRKSRRPALPPLGPDTQDVEPIAPAHLAALGYLPSSTGIVAGLHVKQALTSPAGKGLRTQPIKFGNVELRLDALRDLTGLDVEDIDHLVVGMPDAAELPPPIHLIVRTHRAFNPNQLRATLKARAKPQTAPSERTLYLAQVRGLEVSLWLPDNDTVVLGLFSDLKGVPRERQEGMAHLPANLRTLIEKRLATGMVLWAAGYSDDWKKTWLPGLLGRFQEVPMAANLEQVKGFAVGVIPEKPLKVQAAFQCVDETQAKKLEEQDLAVRAKKEPEQFKYSRDGAWLNVQWRFQVNP